MTIERGSEVEVRIRPFRPDDAGAVHRWFNNREAIASLMEVRAGVQRGERDGLDGGGGRRQRGRRRGPQVGDRGRGQGRAGRLHRSLRALPPDGPRARRADRRRPPGARGVGREAERLTVAKAFEEFGAHRVYGRIPAFNGPAKKAVTWQGWQHEGTMPEHIRRPDGTLIDCEIWGITRAGWLERWRRDED